MTSRTLATDLVARMESMKKAILSAILDTADLSDSKFRAASFRIPLGGLGFNDFRDVQLAAYVASVVMYAQSKVGRANKVSEFPDQHVNLRQGLVLHGSEFSDAMHRMPLSKQEV